MKKIIKLAKKLEKELNVRLQPYDLSDQDNYLGYENLDGEELKGMSFEVLYDHITNEDFPLILCLDTKGGFQFWEESTPVATKHHSKESAQHMSQTLIAEPLDISLFDVDIYKEVLKHYLETLKNIA